MCQESWEFGQSSPSPLGEIRALVCRGHTGAWTFLFHRLAFFLIAPIIFFFLDRPDHLLLGRPDLLPGWCPLIPDDPVLSPVKGRPIGLPCCQLQWTNPAPSARRRGGGCHTLSLIISGGKALSELLYGGASQTRRSLYARISIVCFHTGGTELQRAGSPAPHAFAHRFPTAW